MARVELERLVEVLVVIPEEDIERGVVGCAVGLNEIAGHGENHGAGRLPRFGGRHQADATGDERHNGKGPKTDYVFAYQLPDTSELVALAQAHEGSEENAGAARRFPRTALR